MNDSKYDEDDAVVLEKEMGTSLEDYRGIDLDVVLRTSSNLDDGTSRSPLLDDELSFSDESVTADGEGKINSL